MKTAIYIEDAIVQLVLTPENEFEKNALGSFSQREMQAQIFTGTFYDCRGGWVRQKEYYESQFSAYGYTDKQDTSLIIRIAPPKPPEPVQQETP